MNGTHVVWVVHSVFVVVAVLGTSQDSVTDAREFVTNLLFSQQVVEIKRVVSRTKARWPAIDLVPGELSRVKDNVGNRLEHLLRRERPLPAHSPVGLQDNGAIEVQVDKRDSAVDCFARTQAR